jgi:hypothetical protein
MRYFSSSPVQFPAGARFTVRECKACAVFLTGYRVTSACSRDTESRVLAKSGISADAGRLWCGACAQRLEPDAEFERKDGTPGTFISDFVVVRALLTKGRRYEEAVRRFSSYNPFQERNPDVRTAIRNILIRTQRRRETAYIFVNNRLEGNAPTTIHEILEETDAAEGVDSAATGTSLQS